MKYGRLIQRTRRAAVAAGIALLVLQGWTPAMAGPREQARRLYDRIAGVPPTDAVLTQMAGFIQAGDPNSAAQLALADPSFYNVTLKNFVAPWTNRAQSVFVPLNDYTATVIGMVRDDVDFSTALSADLLYVANTPGAPAYSPANNNHYQYLDDNNIDLSTALQPATQSGLLGLPVAATAGLITTRASASAFFINGTNRAMFRFTMMNHLCRDMPQIQDGTLPPDRIRQDVSRSPGGDSRVFLNSCITCHAGMDPMAQAFAYYNFNATTGMEEYTAGQTQPKYHINTSNFAPGFITLDDSWNNRWRQGANSVIGFSSSLPGSGNGAKSLGQEWAASDAFAECQVVKVFRAMCFRDPGNAADRQAISTIKAKFESDGYKMKQVFADVAVNCMGS